MNEYVLKLCEKYNITMPEDSLRLFSDLFQTIEFVEGTDASIEIENEDILHSVIVRYGKNKDNMIRIYIHIWKYMSEPGYRLGGAYGDIFFSLNGEYYVIHDLDVDELDSESIEFRTACFGKNKIEEVMKKYKGRNYIVPDFFFFGSVESDQEALYTRFIPDIDDDFLTIATKQIELQKENPQRARTSYVSE